MKHWEETSKINLKDEEKYLNHFSNLIKQLQQNKLQIKIGEQKKKDYYIITENRMNSIFIHIVPVELYNLFKKLQKQAPQQFLGYTILAGKHKNKDIRVSCFGVKCSTLTKSLFK